MYKTSEENLNAYLRALDREFDGYAGPLSLINEEYETAYMVIARCNGLRYCFDNRYEGADGTFYYLTRWGFRPELSYNNALLARNLRKQLLAQQSETRAREESHEKDRLKFETVIAGLRAEQEQLSREHAALRKEHTALRKEHEAVQKAQAALKKAYASVQKAHAAVQKENVALRKVHAGLKMAYAVLQRKLLVISNLLQSSIPGA